MEAVSYLTINGETREIIDIQSRKDINDIEERLKTLELITDAPNFSFNINNYNQLQTIVKKGLASEYINIGDQVIVPWHSDNSLSTFYNLPFDVVAINLPITDNYGRAISNNIWLQSHYALISLPYSGVSDNNAFYVPEEDMVPGTYYFTAKYTQGPFTKDENYNFVLTETVPANGQLVFSRTSGSWTSTNLSYWKVNSYNNGIASTPIETVNLSVGQIGNKIGELNLSSEYSSTGMNSIYRIRYGYNRYKYSVVRQWCNGVEENGNWWKPLNLFDRRDSSIQTIQGFMAGLPNEFLNIINPIQIDVNLNTVSDNNLGKTETVIDNFFLPSLKQENFNVSSNTNEEVWPYWIQNSSSSNHIRYSYDDHVTAKALWTRSPYLTNEYYTRYITASGAGANNYSNSTSKYGVTPACVIY